MASRRGAEDLIARGKVKVNGRKATIGDKADPRTDHITVEGKRLAAVQEMRYIMLNKTRGVVTTMKDEKGRKCVASMVENVGARVYPIGRLDKDSEGLLLLTNDGVFANAISHPAKHVPKFYRVTVRPGLSAEQMERFRKGIVLPPERPGEQSYKTLPAEITELSRSITTDEEGNATGERIVVEVVLHEGRNRQIRRMFAAMGVEVARLKRVAIAGVRLGMLPAGKWRDLTMDEVHSLLYAAGAVTYSAKKFKKRGGRRD